MSYHISILFVGYGMGGLRFDSCMWRCPPSKANLQNFVLTSACVDIVDGNCGLHQQHSLNSWLDPMLRPRWGTLSTKQGMKLSMKEARVSILSTSYSSLVDNSTSGGGEGWCLEIWDGWWCSRRDTWKTLWILKCKGNSKCTTEFGKVPTSCSPTSCKVE